MPWIGYSHSQALLCRDPPSSAASRQPGGEGGNSQQRRRDDHGRRCPAMRRGSSAPCPAGSPSGREITLVHGNHALNAVYEVMPSAKY